MKIKRIINGQEMEFELTHIEVVQAFWEQEECHMKEDLETVLGDCFEDEIQLSDSEISAVLQLFKKYHSNSDEWKYDMKDAINVVLNERGNK